MSKKGANAFLYGVIAAILLLCLLDMPYGFYTFVRFAATIFFCLFAYNAYKDGSSDRMILFIVVAVLFQPLIKIPLGRVVWNIVDVIVAAYLLYLLCSQIKNRK